MKVLINGIEVRVQNGFNIKSTLDETLDSGVLEMSICNLSHSIAPDTSLVVVDDQSVKHNFLIAKDEVSLASKNPLSYKHTISYVQNTRILSKTQVRNTVFSQPATPLLKIKFARTLTNNTTATTMRASNYSYSEKKGLFEKQKVSLAFFTFDFAKWVIKDYTTTRPVQSGKNFNIEQSGITLSHISFDVLKNEVVLHSYSFDNVKETDKLYIDKSIFESGNTYSIGNLVVNSFSTNSSDTDNDRYSVAVILNLETYFYSLYDILNILNEQIKKNEIDDTKLVQAPTIEIKKEYVSSSAGYNVYFRLKNNNALTSSVSYSATGSFTASGIISVGANAYSEYFLLGLCVAYENGSISAFSYNENGISATTTQVWSISNAVVPPVLSWTTDTTYGDKWVLTNSNAYDITTYYKFWAEGSDEPSYSNKAMVSGEVLNGTAYFYNKKVYYKYYATNSNGEQSEIIEGYRLCGTLVKLTAPTVEILSVVETDATYLITVNITNPNDVAVECFAKIDSNSFLDKGSIVASNGTATYTFNETKSYGTNGTITAYFTADNRLQSDYSSVPWEFVVPVTAPTLTIKKTYVASSGGYQVSIVIKNNDSATSTLSYVASGDITSSNSYANIASGGETSEIVLGTLTSGNGTILATCSNSRGSASDEQSYSVSEIVARPTIGASSYGNTYTYQFTITQNQSGGTTYYKTRVNGGTWSGETKITASSGITSFVYSNSTTSDITYEISAYTIYNGDYSTTTTLSQVISGKATVALTAPALSTPSVTSSTVSLYISNESNDVSVTFNGTYTGDDGVARAIQTTVGGGSHTVISISWLSEMSFYTIIGKFSASGYNTSVDSNEITVSKPTTPTLTPIVLNSATLHSDGTLEVSYTNSNSVNVSGLFYWQGGAYNASETFTTGTHTLTETGVPTNSSSCFVGTISATGYNDGSTSNTLTYTVTTLSTIYFNGASSVEVGSTSNIYISDSAGDAISGLTVVSSDTGIGTIELVSGTLYHLAGVTAGTFIITASATGYTSNSHSITSSLPTPTLSQPEITYTDTVTANQDGSYYKKSVVSVTNSNSVGVSYSASVNGITSSGSLGPNATTTIGTWEVTDSYGSDTFSVSCSFEASGYNGSSISTSHTL